MPMTIEQIVWSLRSERGRRNENAVGNAVDLLFEECRIDSLTRGPTLERKGIDVRIGIGTKFYNLSVKSSVGGIVHEREIHPWRYKHNDKIFVIPQGGEPTECLADRIIRLTKDFEESMHER